jgi:hypothetical protein
MAAMLVTADRGSSETVVMPTPEEMGSIGPPTSVPAPAHAAGMPSAPSAAGAASPPSALHESRPLDTEMLVAEMQATVPLSVSRREDVEHLRALARERFVPVR